MVIDYYKKIKWKLFPFDGHLYIFFMESLLRRGGFRIQIQLFHYTVLITSDKKKSQFHY